MKITGSRDPTPIHDGNPKTTIVFGKIDDKNKEKTSMVVFRFKWWLNVFVSMENGLITLFLLLYWSNPSNITFNDDNAGNIDEEDDDKVLDGDENNFNDDGYIILYMLYMYILMSDVDYIFEMMSDILTMFNIQILMLNMSDVNGNNNDGNDIINDANVNDNSNDANDNANDSNINANDKSNDNVNDNVNDHANDSANGAVFETVADKHLDLLNHSTWPDDTAEAKEKCPDFVVPKMDEPFVRLTHEDGIKYCNKHGIKNIIESDDGKDLTESVDLLMPGVDTIVASPATKNGAVCDNNNENKMGKRD